MSVVSEITEMNPPRAPSLDPALTAAATGWGANIWVTLGEAIEAAYTAYSNGTEPVLKNYEVVASIYVYELEIKEFFGFAACASDSSHNIIALRGTQTDDETALVLHGWGDNTECLLPTSSSDQLGYGEVKEDLYDFYAFGPRDTFYDSLADSFNQAVAQLAQVNPDKPWAIAGHSLGGALATLGAIDAVVGSTYNGPNNPNPLLVTFGSLHVGLESFKEQFKLQVPQTLRFANLCDFVPSLVSLEPFTNPKPYEHVGVECTFIWQKWDDWANHSMDLYLETIRDHMGVIKVGPRHYPE